MARRKGRNCESREGSDPNPAIDYRWRCMKKFPSTSNPFMNVVFLLQKTVKHQCCYELPTTSKAVFAIYVSKLDLFHLMNLTFDVVSFPNLAQYQQDRETKREQEQNHVVRKRQRKEETKLRDFVLEFAVLAK